jgi:hypothetical protein
MPQLTPPTRTTFFVSLIIFLIGVIGHLIPEVGAKLPYSTTWAYPAVAYILLAIGVLVRGV